MQTRNGVKPYLRYVRYIVSCQRSLSLPTFKPQGLVDGNMFFISIIRNSTKMKSGSCRTAHRASWRWQWEDANGATGGDVSVEDIDSSTVRAAGWWDGRYDRKKK